MGDTFFIEIQKLRIIGDIMRMPGLPKDPQAKNIDIVDGNIEGLS